MFFISQIYENISLQPDGLLSSKIQSLCPTINGDICCTLEQFETLHSQVQQVQPIIQFIKPSLA
jgi:Niemann-Pick C1 protein